jgi:hypothetical protein
MNDSAGRLRPASCACAPRRLYDSSSAVPAPREFHLVAYVRVKIAGSAPHGVQHRRDIVRARVCSAGFYPPPAIRTLILTLL